MRSVNSSIEISCSLLRETTQVWLLQLCLPNLTGSGEIDGPRQFRTSNFYTLVENQGVFSTTLLTSRSRHSSGHCPISADTIGSQIVRNERYEAVDRKLSQLVFQEVFDFWRATTPDPVNISDTF